MACTHAQWIWFFYASNGGALALGLATFLTSFEVFADSFTSIPRVRDWPFVPISIDFNRREADPE